jgi:hypothetical protein
MGLTCNIDQRGRKARLVSGVIVDVCGSGLLVAGLLTGQMVLIIGGAVVSVAGTFMIFEGAVGWCVVRAMGFKTKL